MKDNVLASGETLEVQLTNVNCVFSMRYNCIFPGPQDDGRGGRSLYIPTLAAPIAAHGMRPSHGFGKHLEQIVIPRKTTLSTDYTTAHDWRS